MFSKYLVTGATGFLGTAIIKKLKGRNCKVRVLAVPDDPYICYLPEDIEITYGYVDDPETLKDFFDGDLSDACLIHSAALISIASKKNPMLEKVNFGGTKNIMDMAKEKNLKKVVYVSTVHVIPEKPKGEILTEYYDIAPEKVEGHYAKSKCLSTLYVLKMAKEGLPVSIVQPSGMIGPEDYRVGNILNAIISYCKGKLTCGLKGGYDFADVRDVADGVLSCSERGRNGELYILSGRYITVTEILNEIKRITGGKKIRCSVPLWLVRMIAPMAERMSIRKGKTLFLTPYSVYTLGCNGHFSHQKATDELGYNPRATEETLKDIVNWLDKENKI